MPSSALVIGPLEYKSAVQSISIQENKAVEIIETTRSNRNFLIDSGQSDYRANVRLIFSGIDEINNHLRPLIALFRCTPFISIQNEFLSISWQRYGQFENNTVASLPYIPVALEELTITTAPDLPFTLYVNLTLSRIDVTCIHGEQLLYQGSEPYDFHSDPRNAVWLKKWIRILLDRNIIPTISTGDFDAGVAFTWYGENILGAPVKNADLGVRGYNYDVENLNFKFGSSSKIMSEACTIRNKFAYMKLIGRSVPTVQHMASTSRFYSADIFFDSQRDDIELKAFQKFKETSDIIVRNPERIVRAQGWILKSPVAALLSVPRDIYNTMMEKRKEGVFVPINMLMETGENPGTKTARIDLAENNIDFLKEQEAIISDGGTDYRRLKAYFLQLMENDWKFRRELKQFRNNLLQLVGEGDPEALTLYDAYQTVWPTENASTDFKQTNLYGILNIDTLRAAFLNPIFDTGSKLQLALQESTLATGGLVIGPAQPPVQDRLIYNLESLVAIFTGPNVVHKDIAAIYRILREYTANKFLSFVNDNLNVEEDLNKILDEIAWKLTLAYLGDRSSWMSLSSEAGSLLQRIANSGWKFQPDFLNALFDTICYRNPPPPFIVKAFEVDGLHTAFFKFITKYTTDLPSQVNGSLPDTNRTPVENEIIKRKRKSAYPDMLLPSYIDLYGDENAEGDNLSYTSSTGGPVPNWTRFAPTFRDIGLINTNVKDIQNKQSIDDAQSIIAVDPNDKVSPSAWFYNRKFKPKLLEGLTGDSKALAKTSERLSLKVPFNTKELEDIKELMSKNNTQPDQIRTETLSAIIRTAFDRYRTYGDQDSYREDIRAMKLLGADEKLLADYTGPNAKRMISVYAYSTEGLEGRVTIPGLGGEIYKVLKDFKRLEPTAPLEHYHSSINEQYSAANDETEFAWIRNMDKGFQESIKSSIDQITDYHESANKLFPTVKVYLIDRRGTDVIADDSFFNVNPIVSVDITLDKDDADLAVIKIADPLYILQSQYFPPNNVQNVTNKDGDVLGDLVLTSIKGPISDGYMKRYKIAQGRAVMIKMGYDSLPENLQTVFTGRISEIVPGDVLTLVCQGWKAELINRQVNFYNDNPRSWGAKELAIQTITEANPEGFGEHIADRDARFVLNNLSKLVTKDIVQQSLRVAEDSVNVGGTRNVLESIQNWFVEAFGFRSMDRHMEGIDTRLKNIWYPSVPKFINPLGLRSKFSVLPSYINDSWIIPLMPAWDALKEASRHGWNTIVQVVPFDGEATIFFGNPDQPYFFTRKNDYLKSGYEKYFKSLETLLEDKTAELEKGFEASSFCFVEQPFSSYILDIYMRNTGWGNPTLTLSERLLGSPDKQLKELPELLTDPNALTRHLDTTINRYENMSSYHDFNFGKYTSCFRLFQTALTADNYSALEESVNGRKVNLVANSILFSSLPSMQYENLKTKFGSRTARLLIRLFLGIAEKDVLSYWPAADRHLDLIMQRVTSLQLEKIRNEIKDSINIDTVDYAVLVQQLKDILSKLVADYEQNKLVGSRTGYATAIVELSDRQIKEYIDRATNRLLRLPVNEKTSSLRSLLDSILNKRTEGSVKDAISKANGIAQSLSFVNANSARSSFKFDTGDNLGDWLASDRNIALFKAYVYFLGLYITDDERGREIAGQMGEMTGSPLAANMKTFRVHHHVDNIHDIIANNIVASTKEMWNAVVIEHPAISSATSIAKDLAGSDSPFREGNLYSGIKWNYWPKREVTGVMGLQYHPGLTMANKKLKIFTELNCQSEELAAKLACGHLAEGIRKMYRGNLAVTGRHIKPYDRIHLFDDYTRMHGMLEAETVVHHWSCETGWVTNIIPNAICDANPGAAILQTAMMEVVFGRVFKAIDIASDLLMWATIIGALGGTATLTAGEFATGTSLKSALKNLFTQGPVKSAAMKIEQVAGSTKNIWTETLKGGKNIPIELLRSVFKSTGGPGVSLLQNYATKTTLDQAAHLAFKFGVIPAFIENSRSAEQLPVLLTPLRFNGQPFLAGLETSDPVYSIWANGIYYSWRDIQLGAQRVLDEFGSTY